MVIKVNDTESISSCGVSDNNEAYQADSNDKNSRVQPQSSDQSVWDEPS